MITRYNYEEYFLLYVDNELSDAERKTVEKFIQQNPDLREELTMLQQSIIQPGTNISFPNKDLLLKQTEESTLINLSNYEEYFLLYVDNELDHGAKKDIEAFILENPSLQNEFNLLQLAKLEPGADSVFEGKEGLYKKEEKRRSIPLGWMSAAAVAILLITGFILYNIVVKKQTEDQQRMASATDNKNHNEKASSMEKNRKEDLAVTKTQADSFNKSEVAKKQMAVKENDIQKQKQVSDYNQQKNKIINKKNNNIAATIRKLKDETQPKNAKAVEIAKTTSGEKEINTGLTTSKVNLDPNTVIAKTDQTEEVSKNNTESSYAKQVAMAGDDIDYIDTDNTSAKKNKLRGIFRRVSRVFEKTTNVDDGNKKSVAIGSFQIALK